MVVRRRASTPRRAIPVVPKGTGGRPHELASGRLAAARPESGGVGCKCGARGTGSGCSRQKKKRQASAIVRSIVVCCGEPKGRPCSVNFRRCKVGTGPVVGRLGYPTTVCPSRRPWPRPHVGPIGHGGPPCCSKRAANRVGSTSVPTAGRFARPGSNRCVRGRPPRVVGTMNGKSI
jgi:hypothetical protein